MNYIPLFTKFITLFTRTIIIAAIVIINAPTPSSALTVSSMKPSPPSSSFPSPLSQIRIELFFKNDDELRQRIKWLTSRNIRSFNLVNKNRNDNLIQWSSIVREETTRTLLSPSSSSSIIRSNNNISISTHYSLKFNKSSKRINGKDESYGKFSSFLQSLPVDDKNDNDDGVSTTTEVLLVSGTGQTKIGSATALDSVETLQRLHRERSFFKAQASSTRTPKVSVAFNPFFTSREDIDEERQRLCRKLETNQVNKIYFQFGSSLSTVRSSLEWLTNILRKRRGRQLSTSSTSMKEVDLCGSIFLPTGKLIAQQRFRPWRGVFLCDEFLSSPEGARRIVVELMRLYKEYDVEVLIEAPGVRTDGDLDLVEDLLRERDAEISGLSGSDGVSRLSISDMTVASSSSKDITATADEKKDDDDSGATQNNPSKRQKISRPIFLRPSPSPLVSHDALQKPAIVLFGSFDVRLHDNPSLELASVHPQIIPVFLWNKNEQRADPGGVRGALEVVLKDALRNLHSQLSQHKNNNLRGLICRQTYDTPTALLNLCNECNALTVYWNRECTPESTRREENRRRCLEDDGITVVSSLASLLYDPATISLATGFRGGHWGTLMPFIRTCQKLERQPRRPRSRGETMSLLQSLRGPDLWPEGVSVDDLDMAIVNGRDKWDRPILERFPMTEEEARSQMESFIAKGLPRYEKERSRADLEHSTSKLSAHLRIGTLSPNELYYKTKDCSSLSPDEKKTFSRRLYWRDLAYFQLHTFPSMHTKSIRTHYDTVSWIDDSDESNRRFRAWKRGRTGYPLVDAGMRELYATGWMTQSIRMIAASFLVEYLRVNWVKGCEWFHYTLVDADAAINAMMWQNGGRSGIDQWNFVMSPTAASQDPEGAYVRRWIPELRGLPRQYSHRPWLAPEDVLRREGIILGEEEEEEEGGYPHRIVVDLEGERRKSVESVLAMRRRFQEFNDGGGYDLIALPAGDGQQQRKTVVFTKKEYRIDRDGEVIINTTSSSSKKKSNVVKKKKRSQAKKLSRKMSVRSNKH